MNVLLDACAMLALARGELPDRAATALRSAPEANVSAVTPWEVAIKVAGGKLRLKGPPVHWFLALAERYGLRELPLDVRMACAAAGLPSAAGICCYGAPLFDERRRVLAALRIICPLIRVSPEREVEIVEALLETSREMTVSLRFQ
jgi:PIN domain nuclease of toxin-antitoxin system